MLAVLAGAFAFAPVALPLGIAVWVLTRRDLERMQRGLTDPRGEFLTEEAGVLGGAAIGIALFFIVLGVILTVAIVLNGRQ
jgi:hypothetical protein